LPDIPRWVEARALLLSGECEIFGLEEAPRLSVAVRDPSTGSVIVVGRPSRAAVRAATDGIMHDGSVVALLDDADWLGETLPDWSRTRAILHLLRDSSRLPPPAPNIRLLEPSTIEQLDIPEQLRRELRFGAENSPIMTTVVDNQPVAFCYAGSITESLWVVSIDTLPQYRRRGHAAVCAAQMIRYMATHAKQPVWGSVVENPASWRLAQKIGFEPVDEIALFEPPATMPKHP
jgi:RimJ/RimL family protein N-acetyltransferase